MCKRKVFAQDETPYLSSDSDTDTDDRTPLLNTGNNRSAQGGGGTFVQQIENPFARAARSVSQQDDGAFNFITTSGHHSINGENGANRTNKPSTSSSSSSSSSSEDLVPTDIYSNLAYIAYLAENEAQNDHRDDNHHDDHHDDHDDHHDTSHDNDHHDDHYDHHDHHDNYDTSCYDYNDDY